LVFRDSKGQPQEAARLTRELVNTVGCELLIDAEASSGTFAVQEIVRDLRVACIHSNSESSSLAADPKIRAPTAFRVTTPVADNARLNADLLGDRARAAALSRKQYHPRPLYVALRRGRCRQRASSTFRTFGLS
jgi:branched-chain amino acid transport system substrate-binding protein